MGLILQEIATEPLTSEELRECIPEIAQFLLSTGNESVTVLYGWGTLRDSSTWQSQAVRVADLTDFVEHSERERILRLGGSDLHIKDPEGRFEFRLCHESDIHFSTREEPFLNVVMTLWRQKGFTIYVTRKSSEVPPTWIRLEKPGRKP